MLETYALNAYAQVPAMAWKQTAVNDKYYTFPKSAFAYDSKQVVIIHGDLREKYDLPECDKLENLANYLTTIAEKEDGIVPYQVEEEGGMILTIFYQHSNSLAGFTPVNF